MKKTTSLILVLCLVFAMGINSFAATPGDSEEKEVIVKYNAGITTETVYSVDIEWEDMTFVYTESGEKVWNAETHTYTDNTTAGWNKTEVEVSVTNHSNAEVNVAVAYEENEGTGVSGTLTESEATLNAGKENEPEAADSLTSTLTISGTPNNTVTADGVVLGTITVTITQ